MNSRRLATQDWLICLTLAVVTVILYLPLRDHHFIHLDDHQYVTENPHVNSGLSADNVIWAFTHFHSANWHPLTWISLMLDAQFYGQNPAGFFATNVLLHLAATLLLFLALRRLTATTWKSAAVAALFAWHPLHVESVAWVAERKDVLSAVFWMLTICLYERYAATKSRRFYFVALGAFAAGLMAKPMLVTLPCVLLLLDFWPLGRIGLPSLSSLPRAVSLAAGTPTPGPASPIPSADGKMSGACDSATFISLITEKLPFFFLSIAASFITVAAQKSDSAVASLNAIPLSRRLAHSLISYFDYLVHAVWPANLAIYYPFPDHDTAGDVILAVGVLALLTWLAFILRRSQPWLLVGWLWYLGTLVPVIGLVQVGMQSSADRYTYLPLIGIFIAVVWSGGAIIHALRLPSRSGRVIAAAALTGCLVVTHHQLPYWHDSVALFSHTLSVTGKNPIALVNLAAETWEAGEYGRAMAYYRTALKWDPANADAARGIAVMYVMQGNPDKALALFQQIIVYRPLYGLAHLGAGVILSSFGRDPEAIAALERAVQLEPANDDGWFQLGVLYLRNHRAGEAADCFKKSLSLQPDRADAQMNLATACQLTARQAEAEHAFLQALKMAPAYPGLNSAYGLFLVQQQRMDLALKHLLKAIELKQGEPRSFLYAGLILTTQHHDREAVNLLRTALKLQPGDPNGTRALAWILATSADDSLRNGPEALQLAEGLAFGHPNEPLILDTLAAAQAENGQFEQATTTAAKAVDLARNAGQVQFSEAVQKRMEAYREGKPWRERPGK